MKTVGKIAALAVTLALAGVLTACSGSASSGSASASASASAASASASAAASSASASAAASSAAASDFKVGTEQAGTYANEFFGVKLVLPEGFSFYDDAQMAELNKSVGELQTDEDIVKALESGKAFFDMAAGSASGATVNAVIAYAGTPEAQALDAAAYLEYAKAGLESQLSSAGAKLKDAQVGTYKNDKSGDEFASMKVQFDMQGTPMYENLVCMKAGDYFITITATSPDQAELDKILENLALIK